MQLFEEEHAHWDLRATILRYEQPSCCMLNKQGKISCLIAAEIRDN